MECNDFHERVGAYVDGELMPDESEAVRLHVASCAPCAREYETLAGLSRSIRLELERPRAPDVLKARIRSSLSMSDVLAPPAPSPMQSRLRLIAAGLMIALVSGGTSYVAARRSSAAAPISEQVLASHIRSLMPGHLTDVTSTDLHNVKPWFNGRLDLSPAVPRLDSSGFPLIGGRLDYVGGRSVAVVVYGRRQHVINVFSWPSTGGGERAPVVSVQNGYHLVRWSSGGSEFWAASDLSITDLDHFVALFTQSVAAAAS